MELKREMLVVIGLLLVVLILPLGRPYVQASPSKFTEEKVQIEREDTVLDGTILVPEASDSRAGIVMVHGAGAHDQNAYRKNAEAFAEAGIAVLIYDKRTVGYSASGVGENARSYSLLANDAIAAAEVLRSQAEVDPENVGLWGESEGASVALLAGSRSPYAAFIITVGANGVTPIQQTSWHLENILRYQGVTADSFIEAVTKKGLRSALSAEMFAEATFQIIPVLKDVQQPTLAVWGQNDRNSPPAESAEVFRQTFEGVGKEEYILQFIPGAGHTLRSSSDGFEQVEDDFAPGAMEGMITFVNDSVRGEPLGPTVRGSLPSQANTSDPAVNEPTIFDSTWLHLAFILASIVLFVTDVVLSINIRRRKQPVQMLKTSIRWLMRGLSLLGLATIIGLYFYNVYIIVTHDASPILFGRPFIWLLLQSFAWIIIILTLILAVYWRRNRTTILGREKLRIVLLLLGGILFVPWAFHWELLIS